MKLESLLMKHFNYSTFRQGQKEIILSILEGRHTIAMLPTGTGKSLCYQLPAYVLHEQVVVISPLLSLMQDQVEQLMMNGEKRVIAFNSFLSAEEKQQALIHLHTYKFIFLSPEMLRAGSVMRRLQEISIALFVIDEAHCISQWGYDFRPDYLKLGEVRQALGQPLTLALTATATPEVKDDIIRSLALDDLNEFIYSVDRPNISLSVVNVGSYHEKMEKAAELVKRLAGPGIIYFSSKKMSERMASFLKEKGMDKVMAYHGGMEQENRILIQQQFIQGQLDVICATSAFGMGINKDNIRFVLHYHMPLQLESYLQEIGRAGRDGEKSIAILLYVEGDEQLPYQLAEGELPSHDQIDLLFSFLEKQQPILQNMPLFESEIRRITGITELQWRIIEDFLQAEAKMDLQKSAGKLKAYVNARLQVKRIKINEMYKWTQSNECRRNHILRYFKEDKITGIEDCCDICGIEMMPFYQKINQKEEVEPVFEWEKYLAKLLINE